MKIVYFLQNGAGYGGYGYGYYGWWGGWGKK